MYTHMYIYIYICVCNCVCVGVGGKYMCVYIWEPAQTRSLRDWTQRTPDTGLALPRVV